MEIRYINIQQILLSIVEYFDFENIDRVVIDMLNFNFDLFIFLRRTNANEQTETYSMNFVHLS